MLGVTTWPDVVIAAIVALPGILASVLAYLNRRAIRTPSGDKIGEVMERTHDLSAADVALTTHAVRILADGSVKKDDNAA